MYVCMHRQGRGGAESLLQINGWTEPSVQDLRELILQHGGIFHAYLDKKSLVYAALFLPHCVSDILPSTHIITCSLTPAKVKEFQYMKVVRPEWLLRSVEAGVLLPWSDFIFKPGDRTEISQGKKSAQTMLSSSFLSQAPKPSTSTQRNQPLLTPTIRDPDDAHIPTSTAAPVAGPSTPPRTPQKSKSTTNSPSRRPLYTTDPVSPEQAERVPDYAADKSNLAAERAMADPAWRAAHTSIAPDFIEGYYRNSRLHHLSTWKAELRNLVAEAQEKAEHGAAEASAATAHQFSQSDSVSKIIQENMNKKGWGTDSAEDLSMKGVQLVKKNKGKGKEKATDVDEDRVIMHCDFDSFFVSAGLIDRPHLRGKPVVVCHSQGAQGGLSSTSEIASASYEARQFGIRGGMRYVV